VLALLTLTTHLLLPSPTAVYTLSLHDALPIFRLSGLGGQFAQACVVLTGEELHPAEHCLPNQPPEGVPVRCHRGVLATESGLDRSEEHTSELQSRFDLVCRLLPEKKTDGRHRL